MILALLHAIALACGGVSVHEIIGPTYIAVEWAGGQSIDGELCGVFPDTPCYLIISWADDSPFVDWGGPAH